MKLIVDLVRWFWQREPREADGVALHATDGSDRSSMADFVRLLRLHDDDGRRPNYPD